MQDYSTSDTSFINNTEGLSEHRSSRNELTPLYSSNSDNGTIKLIIGFFSIFSIAVTFALALQIYYGNPQVTRYGTVSSISEVCSAQGLSIIQKGGNSVDACITTAFCLSVMYPHVTGVGGGGLMLIYSQREKKVVDTIDFRVTRSVDKRIGIPGFVAGLALAHQLHGILPWQTLIEPAIRISKFGFPVPSELIVARSVVLNATLKDWLSPLKTGEIITVPNLASLLTVISNSTSEEFYNQTLSEELSDYVDKNDVINYVPLSKSASQETYDNFKVITSGDGSGGPLLLETLSNIDNSSTKDKHYGMSDEWPPLYSTTVIALDVDDLYVSLVSGLGSVFGSQILTKSGYILNDFLDLTSDPSYRPAVSMTPVIAVEKAHICGTRFVLGGSNIHELNYVLYKLLHDTSDITNISNGYKNSTDLSLNKFHDFIQNGHDTPPDSNYLHSYLIRTNIINVVKKFMDKVTVYPNILQNFIG